jgi:hypothetical protein
MRCDAMRPTHLDNSGANTPDVRRPARPGLLDNLWGHPRHGPPDGPHALLDGGGAHAGQLLRAPEVRQLGDAGVADQDVRALDVPVNYPFAVQITDS